MKWTQTIISLNFIFLVTLFFGFLALGTWSWFGTLDESIPGVGELVPDGKIRTIRSPINGMVANLYVQENQSVKEGQILIELDPEPTEIEESRFSESLALVEKELTALRSASQMSIHHFQNARLNSNIARSTQGAWLLAAQKSYKAKLESARMHIEMSEHDVQEAVERVNKTQEVLQSSETLLEKYRGLYENDALAEVPYREQERAVQEQRGAFAEAKEALASKKFSLARAKQELNGIQGQFQEEVLSRLSSLEKQWVDLSHNVEKAQLAKNVR